MALWFGRAQELQFFNNRFDVKMYFYVVGGTMLSLNALSGAVYHYELFGEDSNPGVFLYAAFFTFYVLDYFVFERVQLYTYDLIHENVGFKLFWGGLVVYGWMFILPLWGMAAYPDPGFSPAWTNVWLIGTAALFLFGWGISRGANLQKYTFKRWPDRKFLGLIEPNYIEAGDRKILCSGLWGVARHFNYLGEGFLALSIALVFGYFTNPWAWTYLVFIVSLFAYRQRDDDRHCAEKYGAEKWAEYQARVNYRIVPGGLLRAAGPSPVGRFGEGWGFRKGGSADPNRQRRDDSSGPRVTYTRALTFHHLTSEITASEEHKTTLIPPTFTLIPSTFHD